LNAKASVLSLTHSPTNGVDRNRTLTHVCDTYDEMFLRWASITQDDHPQTGMSLQAHFLDSAS
jgi:hypothetical protein